MLKLIGKAINRYWIRNFEAIRLEVTGRIFLPLAKEEVAEAVKALSKAIGRSPKVLSVRNQGYLLELNLQFARKLPRYKARRATIAIARLKANAVGSVARNPLTIMYDGQQF